MFELIPYEKFRDTPAVRFFDITVDNSNARDLVTIADRPLVHRMSPTRAPGSSISTPSRGQSARFNRGRLFYLVNFGWNYPYHIVRLETGGDILRIPPGTFHRSISDEEGSVVLNQAIRDPGASVAREFRVYNSRLIPRLFATTFRSAPLPKLHGVSW